MKLIAIVVMLVLGNVAVAEWVERQIEDPMDDTVFYFIESDGVAIKPFGPPWEDTTAEIAYGCSKEFEKKSLKDLNVIFKSMSMGDDELLVYDGKSVGCEILIFFNTTERASNEKYIKTVVRFDKEESFEVTMERSIWKQSVDFSSSEFAKKMATNDYKRLLIQFPWNMDHYGVFEFDITNMGTIIANLRHKTGARKLSWILCPKKLFPEGSTETCSQ